jgi:hypothetical protein
VSIPEWDPDELADIALEELDKNGDSQIDQREVTSAPGLAFGARFIDTDGDGKLNRDELTARFTKYRDSRVGMTPKELQLTYNGKPLVGADVRLVPEFFLTDVIEPATGKTFGDGTVRPSIADSQTPLMRVGYYRVEVSAANPTIPAKFNSQTTLGLEISPFAGEPATSGKIVLPLRNARP